MLVQMSVVGNVGIIKLNKKPTNTLDLQMLNKLYEYIRKMEENLEIRVVILSSEVQGTFSSGLDLRSLYVKNDKEHTMNNIYNAVSMVYKIISSITASKNIFIASLKGYAIGSAMTISLGCDIRIGCNNAWFWLPDPQYGGLLAEGGLELLRESVGISRTNMIALTNNRIDMKTAYEWGLIYQIESIETVDEHALKLAERLCQYSPHTLSKTKKIINKGILSEFHKVQLNEILHSNELYERMNNYFIQMRKEEEICRWSKR